MILKWSAALGLLDPHHVKKDGHLRRTEYSERGWKWGEGRAGRLRGVVLV